MSWGRRQHRRNVFQPQAYERPRERAFKIKSSVICWIDGIIFVGLLVAPPNPYRWFVWISYGILLPLGINYGNRRQQAIRQAESQDRPSEAME